MRQVVCVRWGGVGSEQGVGEGEGKKYDGVRTIVALVIVIEDSDVVKW